jgi:fructose-1-phosphate kinase PfkB-like protein
MLLKKKYCWCGDVWWAHGLGFISKQSLKEVIRWGVACGSAATMNEEHNCLNSKISDCLNG